jgi:hypothetical protein
MVKNTGCEVHHYAIFSTIRPPPFQIQISSYTLFSKTLSLCSCLRVRHHVSHPYSTTGKITVLYILTFRFLITDEKTKDFRLNDSKHFLNLIYLDLIMNVTQIFQNKSFWIKILPCSFTCLNSLPQFCHYQVMVSIAVSSSKGSDI